MVRNSFKYPADWSRISRRVKKERGDKCEECGKSSTRKRPLQVDHKDGNKKNCSEENLIVLCPACHLKKGIEAGEIKPYILKNISRAKRRYKKN